MSSLSFLDLPPEILSNILSNLPLEELLSTTLLSRRLYFLAQDTSPFEKCINEALDRGSPYPSILGKLGGYSHIPNRLYYNILVRASPIFILEQMELPRLKDSEWKEVFARRFLPSWKKYRAEGDSWRAAYLKTIRRLQHRSLGCTHEEAWTRFIILHRNASSSLNRIYSRTLDPLAIYQEIKQQNNFMDQPTQIRLVCQFQDVRIIAIGVLYDPQSLFINHNAHRLLHPPLLDSLTDIEGIAGRFPDDIGTLRESRPKTRIRAESAAAVLLFNGNTTGTTTGGPLINSPYRSHNEHIPVQRRQPPFQSDTAGQGPGSRSRALENFSRRDRSPPVQPFLTGGIGGGGRTIALASNLARSLRMGSSSNGRSRASTIGSSSWITDGGEATITTGRGGSGGRMSRLFRTGSREVPAAALPEEGAALSVDNGLVLAEEDTTDLPLEGEQEVLEDRTVPIIVQPDRSTLLEAQPYQPLTHPLPASSHRFYPNFTPPSELPSDSNDSRASHVTTRVERTRMSHAKTEQGDEGMARWVEAEVDLDTDVVGGGRIETELAWVGPLLIFAQLTAASRPSDPSMLAQPLARGQFQLGVPGSYCNFDFDDLDCIAPWLELVDGTNGSASNSVGGVGQVEGMVTSSRRRGMGFE